MCFCKEGADGKKSAVCRENRDEQNIFLAAMHEKVKKKLAKFYN